MTDTTCDSLWGGQLRFWQPARGQGYRFNLDPLLLADFVRPAAHVLDLGAGVGVLGIVLLASGKAERITAVEVQPSLCELLEQNARDNGLADRLTVLAGDARHLSLPTVDAVVTNPPYFRADAGRAGPEPGRDMARRERHGTLAELVDKSLQALVPGGRFTGIVPSARAQELVGLLEKGGAGAQRTRHIVPRQDRPPNHFMVEASLGGEAVSSREPQLVVHAEVGRDFSPEVRRILREG